MKERPPNTCLNCHKPIGKDFAFCNATCREEYQRKKQISNEVLHQLLGVDGWQEVYSDAPSEENTRKEMAEDEEKERKKERKKGAREMIRKKRYWLLNVRTGKNYLCDAWSKKEAADKMGVKSTLLRIEKFTYFSEACLLATGGKTIYDIPVEGY